MFEVAKKEVNKCYCNFSVANAACFGSAYAEEYACDSAETACACLAVVAATAAESTQNNIDNKSVKE
jgi:hypothetical protein